MSLISFLSVLFDHGRVKVAPDLHSTEPLSDEIIAFLRTHNAIYRSALPGNDLPPFLPDAAAHAALTLYRACQCAAYREFDAQTVEQAISIPSESSNPADHLSADLVLRFLPDVVRLARAAAPDDPLVQRLLLLGQSRPLSSVGIAGLGDVDLQVLASHHRVWQIYVERVLERCDVSRMSHAAVRQSIRNSVGDHSALLRKYSNILGE